MSVHVTTTPSKFLQFTQPSSPVCCQISSSTLYSSQIQSHFFKAANASAWSPDGTCFLVCEALENMIRLFELPQRYYNVKDAFGERQEEGNVESGMDDEQNGDMHNVGQSEDNGSGMLSGQSYDSWPVCLSMNSKGSPIYDYKWNPHMNSADTESSFFVTSSRGGLLTIWDAFKDNCKRETIRVANHLDRTMDAYSLVFQPDGESVLCGLNHSISIIPLEQPQKLISINTQNFFYPKLLSSIISTMEYNKAPQHVNVFAFGNYNGDVAWVDDRTNQLVQSIESVRRVQLHEPLHEPRSTAHVPLSGNGITQVQFSACGKYLFSASRNDSFVHCWDIRSTPSQRGPVYSMYRDANTNQRIGFDLTHSQLITGSRGGHISKYSLTESGKLISQFSIESGTDAVSGVCLHPILPYFAVCNGERHVQNVPRENSADSNVMSDSSDEEADAPLDERPPDALTPPVVQLWFDRSLMVAESCVKTTE
mmetsp:Transcript_5422/g.20245  ORF Transcript_5422/g.20245 Transcript_5422/m.20245 type:complete len:480 (+) Transcript_5422:164-1603(+)|eukprot:CAMPEP_0117456468 /NCGR_PEP_ID=MMETSP0759-20121206/11892_1 /TAXON_ID=63605 /ORGANISM="Percolomonas cosmopolitus, Strain WS" /LENGTH=479 /DNA_ID=CAMNT_0005249807 /DNA_START=152 /DNA_END=1591 /DNA_ORIENTATION=-